MVITPEQRAELSRASALKRVYGITTAQYKELLDKQDGCCAVCDRHYSVFKVRLAVDHDHVTSEIRGLLCSYCNHRIVGRHRDPDILRRVASYLEGGTGWFVPAKKKKKRKPRGSPKSSKRLV